jgi:hypothetical protein
VVTLNVPPGSVPSLLDFSLEHAFSTKNAAAEPITPFRNRRRDSPKRRALTSARSCVRRMTSRRNASCGTGKNSPFETGPNLIGSSLSSSVSRTE